MEAPRKPEIGHKPTPEELQAELEQLIVIRDTITPELNEKLEEFYNIVCKINAIRSVLGLPPES